MSQPVFLLLSMLFVQGRGCNPFMDNLLSNIENEIERHTFRKVFPKDYNITHHYTDSLDVSDPSCRMLCKAYMLSHSWSQLLLHLWEENLNYLFIQQLKESLDNITDGRFPEVPDPSVFPPVSSTPEALLAFTSTFFSTWLKQQCTFPKKQFHF
ncbi:hypothetical protein COCON_G00005170 [Conger conger]|uniref:Uncharacterized protein n=1 Tax=Conger conger TaxID=82655 RepID=A0A9Q1E1F4_CONCO|nr:hypothetical protein COCON_G00005170 [Conger conger]